MRKNLKRFESPELKALYNKLYNKISEYEKDGDQIYCMIVGAYQANDKPIETMNKLYDYLCDPNTIKTRHTINEYILEMDTEFQKRVKANILKNAEKITF